jgi:hypothetical protein
MYTNPGLFEVFAWGVRGLLREITVAVTQAADWVRRLD